MWETVSQSKQLPVQNREVPQLWENRTHQESLQTAKETEHITGQDGTRDRGGAL